MRKLNLKKPSFIKQHERLLMPVFLLLGFAVDWITLNRVDQVFDNIVLLVYVVLSGVAILIFHSQIQNRGAIFRRIKELSNLLLQYAFGGLFSGLFIFYFRSSSFVTSLPFLLILILLFLGNELFNKKYQRLILQVSIFYVGIFSYSNLVTPLLIGRISVWIFLLASLLSLLIFHLFILLTKKIIIDTDKVNNAYKYVGAIFSLFIFFYFTNVIPPIPLSLKESHVAHEITKQVGENSEIFYTLELEKSPWYVFWDKYNSDIHVFDNEPVYIFSSVFAPTNFKGTVYHQWSYFDDINNRWRETDRIPIEIIGGQDSGFRGYSLKNNVTKGTWRVDVETQRGQVIGRNIFDVMPEKENTELIEVWK
jgi:hypothetical protein